MPPEGNCVSADEYSGNLVLVHLMMLAFLIDQIQQRGCRLLQVALTAAQSKTRLWRKLRSRFDL